MMTTDLPPLARPYEEYSPPPTLRGYVSCFWQSNALDQPHHTTILPDGCIDLIWQADREPFVAGPMTVPAVSTSPPRTVTLGVRFQPGAAIALLGLSAGELRDAIVPLPEIRPRARQRPAWDRARAVTETMSLTNAADAVHAMLREAMPPDCFIADACRWLARHPRDPAAAFLAGSGLSERQARRRFLEHVGYGPKTLQRILRMQRVLWLLSRPSPPRSLANLALAAGYADQAHLTRELRALTGQLPTTLVSGNPQSAVADLFKTPAG